MNEWIKEMLSAGWSLHWYQRGRTYVVQAGHKEHDGIVGRGDTPENAMLGAWLDFKALSFAA